MQPPQPPTPFLSPFSLSSRILISPSFSPLILSGWPVPQCAARLGGWRTRAACFGRRCGQAWRGQLRREVRPGLAGGGLAWLNPAGGEARPDERPLGVARSGERRSQAQRVAAQHGQAPAGAARPGPGSGGEASPGRGAPSGHSRRRRGRPDQTPTGGGLRDRGLIFLFFFKYMCIYDNICVYKTGIDL